MLIQTTTKLPEGSEATFGDFWLLVVRVLTRNSVPAGAPELAKR
jgi:hypothetical protein